jgi:hypothetical protein
MGTAGRQAGDGLRGVVGEDDPYSDTLNPTKAIHVS